MKHFAIEKQNDYVRNKITGDTQLLHRYYLTIEEEGFDNWEQAMINVQTIAMSEEEYLKLRNLLNDNT